MTRWAPSLLPEFLPATAGDSSISTLGNVTDLYRHDFGWLFWASLSSDKDTMAVVQAYILVCLTMQLLVWNWDSRTYTTSVLHSEDLIFGYSV